MWRCASQKSQQSYNFVFPFHLPSNREAFEKTFSRSGMQTPIDSTILPVAHRIWDCVRDSVSFTAFYFRILDNTRVALCVWVSEVVAAILPIHLGLCFAKPTVERYAPVESLVWRAHTHTRFAQCALNEYEKFRFKFQWNSRMPRIK